MAAARRAVLALALWSAAALAGEAPWLDAGHPGAQARAAVELMAAADTHGLDPHDYDVDALRRSLAAAAHDGTAAERLDRALTAAMQRYLSDLHRGRIDPRSIHHDFDVDRRPAFDEAALLREALAAGHLPEAVQQAAPRLPLYGQLREALAHYRGLAGHPAWRQRLPALPSKRGSAAGALEPAHAWDGVAALAERLVVLGDLPSGTVVPAGYDGVLVEAVRAFQQRHGLAADGVVGKATLAQLEVPPQERVRQIELTLERLRWTPLMQGPRMVVINIPEFVLRAYEVDGGRIRVQREMKVVVGKAMDTRTPLFDEDMRFIEFSPYWNVPPSIAHGELVPRLRRDPGYFAREGFEFVDADGSVHSTLTAPRLDAVLAGTARIRQRPGARNALGDIKFVFPNRTNIYLHHTPSVRLFERDRRDFSHGCIRVEQPVALATFVLANMPQWTEARIREAMSSGRSATLRLAEPVPVLIAYGTTLVKGGRIHFYDDLYGHDRLLDAALRRPRPPPAAVPWERP